MVARNIKASANKLASLKMADASIRNKNARGAEVNLMRKLGLMDIGHDD